MLTCFVGKPVSGAGHPKILPGYAALCKLLTAWRHTPETLWLAEAPAQALQQALKDLDRAWTNHFAGRADSPRFKKRGQGDSFRYPDAKQIHLDEANSRIFSPPNAAA